MLRSWIRSREAHGAAPGVSSSAMLTTRSRRLAIRPASGWPPRQLQLDRRPGCGVSRSIWRAKATSIGTPVPTRRRLPRRQDCGVPPVRPGSPPVRKGALTERRKAGRPGAIPGAALSPAAWIGEDVCSGRSSDGAVRDEPDHVPAEPPRLHRPRGGRARSRAATADRLGADRQAGSSELAEPGRQCQGGRHRCAPDRAWRGASERSDRRAAAVTNWNDASFRRQPPVSLRMPPAPCPRGVGGLTKWSGSANRAARGRVALRG